jgi:hypothetical protein
MEALSVLDPAERHHIALRRKIVVPELMPVIYAGRTPFDRAAAGSRVDIGVRTAEFLGGAKFVVP